MVRPAGPLIRKSFVPDQPASDLTDLTNEELRRYQKELEHSLNGLPPGAPVRELVAQKLALVLAEEEARGGRNISQPR
jgi:hypothetical protein